MRGYDKISPGSIFRGSNFFTIWNTRNQNVSRALQSSLCNLYLKNLKLSHKILQKITGFIPQEFTAASDAISFIPLFKIQDWQEVIWWNVSTQRFPRQKFKSASPCLLQFVYSKNNYLLSLKKKEITKKNANTSSTKPLQQLQPAK